MKYNYNIQTLIIAIMFLTLSCGKNKLPKLTESGENTFGCKLDNKVVKTNVSNGYIGTPVAYEFLTDSVAIIYAITEKPKRTFYIAFHCQDGILKTHNANNYIFNDYPHMLEDGISTSEGKYLTNENLTATVTVTKFSGDPTLGAKTGDILSGTFDMYLRNNNGKTIHLTDGRFDLVKK